MKTTVEATANIETFIERFSFNKDADIQYLVHGFYAEKPYIELLRASITKLIKSQKEYKKMLTTVKIRTDKNAKKYNELHDNLEMDFLRMVNILKDSHHFFMSIFKIDVFTKKNISCEEMYRTYADASPSFTDLMQQIDFTREERYVLNTFNRMRNIIIHAPSKIIIGYLTENVLEQFKSCINISIGIANTIITRILESINGIVKYQQGNIKEHGSHGIENVKSFASRYNLTTNELLEIMKNSGHDFSFEIHQDMELDSYSKAALIPLIEEKIRQKDKAANEVKFQENISNLYQSESFMVVDFDYVLSLSNNDINKTYNRIYEVYVNCKIKKLFVFSNIASKEILQVIDELHFTTKNKQKISNGCNELLEYISSLKNIATIIAYADMKTIDCLNEHECNKYLIVKNKDALMNKEIKNWNKLVVDKNEIIDII